MPTITQTEFRNPNPKLNQVFFNNYIETKPKDIQQLQSQSSNSDFFGLKTFLFSTIRERVEFSTKVRRERVIQVFNQKELGFWPRIRERGSLVFSHERERERESLEILFEFLRFNFYVVFGCQESLIEIEKVTQKRFQSLKFKK